MNFRKTCQAAKRLILAYRDDEGLDRNRPLDRFEKWTRNERGIAYGTAKQARAFRLAMVFRLVVADLIGAD